VPSRSEQQQRVITDYEENSPNTRHQLINALACQSISVFKTKEITDILKPAMLLAVCLFPVVNSALFLQKISIQGKGQ